MKKSRAVKILDAARELFLSNGYYSTSMDKIAKKAGYSKRTLYLDYDNKDELFIKVGTGGLEMLLEKIRAIPQNVSIEDFMDKLLEVVFWFSNEHSEYFRIFFGDATPQIIANCPEKLRRRVAGLEHGILSVVAAQVERAKQKGLMSDIDPWDAAGIFIGAVTGIVMLSMAGSQTVFTKERLDSMARKAAVLIWLGLCSHPSKTLAKTDMGNKFASGQEPAALGQGSGC